MKRTFFLLITVFSLLPATAQYRVDRLITAGRSALYYEDYVLSIQYFNHAITAKPYLYEPWYYRGIAKFNLDDYAGAERDAGKAIDINPYIDGIYDLRAICRIRQKNYQAARNLPMPIRSKPRYSYIRKIPLRQPNGLTKVWSSTHTTGVHGPPVRISACHVANGKRPTPF